MVLVVSSYGLQGIEFRALGLGKMLAMLLSPTRPRPHHFLET